MALTHVDFATYPLTIAGINKSEGSGESLTYLYDATIAGLEDFVISDMAYVGIIDVSAVLKYFVFWFFCQDRYSTVTANAGENIQIDKVSQPSYEKQIAVWNIGVEKLRELLGVTQALVEARHGLIESDRINTVVESLDISVNKKYLSKRSLI